MNVATSRGCPYHCNWCAKPIWGQRYHVRSPENVAAEIAWLKSTYRPDHIWFADDIFGLKPGWVEQFAVEVEAHDARVPFKSLQRVDLLQKGTTVEALQRSGAQRVWVGAESGSQKILDAMEKGTRVEQIYEAARKLRAAGIEVGFFLQFGYPGETREDIERTLQMVRDCRPDDIGMSVSYPLPGTRFFAAVQHELGAKQNWQDSEDLAMLYQRPLQHRLLSHAASSAASRVPLAQGDGRPAFGAAQSGVAAPPPRAPGAGRCVRLADAAAAAVRARSPRSSAARGPAHAAAGRDDPGLTPTMDVLLTHGYFLYDDPHELAVMKPYPPLGLLYISSHLKARGVDASLFDTTFSSLAALETCLTAEPSASRRYLRQPDDARQRPARGGAGQGGGQPGRGRRARSSELPGRVPEPRRGRHRHRRRRADPRGAGAAPAAARPRESGSDSGSRVSGQELARSNAPSRASRLPISTPSRFPIEPASTSTSTCASGASTTARDRCR